MTPQEVLADPNFQALPEAERIKVLMKVDPDRFGKLPAQEQLKVVGVKPSAPATSEVSDLPGEGWNQAAADKTQKPESSFGSRVGAFASGVGNTTVKPLLNALNPLNAPQTAEAMTGSKPYSVTGGPIADMAAELVKKLGLTSPGAEAGARVLGANFARSGAGIPVMMAKGLLEQGASSLQKGHEALAKGDAEKLAEAIGEGTGLAASVAAGGAKGSSLGKAAGALDKVGLSGVADQIVSLFGKKPKAAVEAPPTETSVPQTSYLASLPPELRQIVSTITTNLAHGAAKIGRTFDLKSLDNILPPELQGAKEQVGSLVTRKAAAILESDDFMNRLKDEYGDHPTGPKQELEIKRHGNGSFDVVQRSGGKVVGGAEIRGGDLTFITGGKLTNSPVSAAELYKTVDQLGAKRNNVLTPFGEEARISHAEKQAQAAGTSQVGGGAAGENAAAAGEGGSASGRQEGPGGAGQGVPGPGPQLEPSSKLEQPPLLPSQKAGTSFQKPLATLESYLEKTPASAGKMQEFKRAQQVGPQGIVSNMARTVLDRVSKEGMSDEDIRNVVGTSIEDAKKQGSEHFDQAYREMDQAAKNTRPDITTSQAKAKSLLKDLSTGSNLMTTTDPAVQILRKYIDNPSGQSFQALKNFKTFLYDQIQGQKSGQGEMIGSKGQGALKELIKSVDGDMEKAAAKVPGLMEKMRTTNKDYGEFRTTFNESVISDMMKHSNKALRGETGAKTVAQLIDGVGPEGMARVRNTLPQPVYQAATRNWLEGKLTKAVTGELSTEGGVFRGKGGEKTYPQENYPTLAGPKLRQILEGIGEDKLRSVLEPQTYRDLQELTQTAERLGPKGGQGLMGSLLASQQYTRSANLVRALVGGAAIGTGSAPLAAGLAGEQLAARALAGLITRPGGAGTLNRLLKAAGKTQANAAPLVSLYGKSLERMLEEEEKRKGQASTSPAPSPQ
jgi:hypothetical protein